MIFDKGNFVKINYCGKDYIGQVLQIDTKVTSGRLADSGELLVDVNYFKVKLLEFPTNCIIDNIIIYKFSDIQHYQITEKDV